MTQSIYTVFARADYDGAPLTNLIDIVNYVKPTALLGFSTINVNSILTLHDHKVTLVLQYTFDEEVVSAMVSLNKRPIIFPLSNPVLLCEVDYDVAIKWTNSKVVYYSSGSPNQKIEWEGQTREPNGQGNNLYIFPGIDLGQKLVTLQMRWSTRPQLRFRNL